MTRHLFVLPVCVVLAACGGAEIKTEADAPPETVTVTVTETVEAGATTEETTTEEVEPEAEDSGRAGVGDTITLHGFEDGEEVAVTVKRVIDPAEAEQYFGPSQGHKFVAVELALRNTGTAAYSDSPGNGAQLIDTEDQSYTEAIFESPSCHYIGSNVKIATGSRRTGCLIFEVPKKSRPAAFQFALDSGFADETGEWTLR